MNLQRYNLGFKYFGPLEQSSSGKLMKAAEVDQYIKIQYWKQHAEITKLSDEINSKDRLIVKHEKQYLDLYQKYKKIKYYNQIKLRLLLFTSLMLVGSVIVDALN